MYQILDLLSKQKLKYFRYLKQKFYKELVNGFYVYAKKKEKDNEYDREAISVNLPGLGKIGYVANSPYTVLGESYSAGRLYDKISEEASGKVRFILDRGVICELIE